MQTPFKSLWHDILVEVGSSLMLDLVHALLRLLVEQAWLPMLGRSFSGLT
jgi:hypothetical protein